MKNQALKDIKNTSVKIAVDSVKKILSTSVDQSKLDNLFDKNLEESKELLKKLILKDNFVTFLKNNINYNNEFNCNWFWFWWFSCCSPP